MTLANKITFLRICLTPLFGVFGLLYAWLLSHGIARPGLRITVIIIFFLAAASDGLDGFVARHFNQKTRLGAILDPVADKLLIFVALILLSIDWWPNHFPIWYPMVVMTRDLGLLLGFAVLTQTGHSPQVRPSWPGKLTTALQLASIAWILLGFTSLPSVYLAVPAATAAIGSGIDYLIKGFRQISWTKNISAD